MKTLTLLQDYANSSDNVWLAKQLEILEWEIEQKEKDVVVLKPLIMKYIGEGRNYLTTGKEYVIDKVDGRLFYFIDDEGDFINQYKHKFESI
jgi:hypothetical protein